MECVLYLYNLRFFMDFLVFAFCIFKKSKQYLSDLFLVIHLFPQLFAKIINPFHIASNLFIFFNLDKAFASTSNSQERLRQL